MLITLITLKIKKKYMVFFVIFKHPFIV